MSEPLARFTVRIHPHRETITVQVWPTLGELRAWAYKRWSFTRGRRIYGLCCSYERYYASGKLAPDFAEVNFARKHMGSGTLAHELGHAAIAWCRKRRITGEQVFGLAEDWRSTEQEEAFCTALQELMRETVNKLYALDLLE